MISGGKGGSQRELGTPPRGWRAKLCLDGAAFEHGYFGQYFWAAAVIPLSRALPYSS